MTCMADMAAFQGCYENREGGDREGGGRRGGGTEGWEREGGREYHPIRNLV